MVSCSKCPNWTCYNVAGDDDDGQGCLTVSSAALLDNNTVFVCPACHRNTERLSKSSIPYEVWFHCHASHAATAADLLRHPGILYAGDGCHPRRNCRCLMHHTPLLPPDEYQGDTVIIYCR